VQNSKVNMTTAAPSIDQYLRRRLMPVEGAIPHLPGIDMYGNSIPAETVGGDLFEYINFQQRYNIDARIARARRLAEECLLALPPGVKARNEVDVHVCWMRQKRGCTPEREAHYREAKSSEQLRVAEHLQELYTMAGVLLVDAQGHGIIAAKIASTVHDTFHAFMLSELDRIGKTTTDFCEKINLRLAQSVTARNALGRSTDSLSREIATMLYGEIHPDGIFRFINFGHPPPLVFSAEFGKFMEIHQERMVQFPALGLEIPEDHPDRSKYVSMKVRQRQMDSDDLAAITLMNRGDILFLHSDGVYDGVDDDERVQLEQIMSAHADRPAREICAAILAYAVERDRYLREIGEADRIDDKTVFIIKRSG
jgi:serine phosphatase RsbU (regulator of sigma subunit)